MQPAVYIITNKRNSTLYIGVTSNLVRRIWQHREQCGSDFTSRYGVTLLVYYELHSDMYSAITREKQIKKWVRAWKLRLIERSNPEWEDLWGNIVL